jgi:hypothetical protein
VCCATARAQAQAQAQAQGELRARRTTRASSALKPVVRCCTRGPPQWAPSMGPLSRPDGDKPGTRRRPRTTHPFFRSPARRSTSRRLECMMRCGPPHQTSRRSQHASCLACTALPSDVCGEMGPSLVTRQPLVCFSVRDAHGCLHAAHHNPQYPQRDQQCKYRYARNEPDIISICLSYGIALQPGLRRQKLLLRSVRSTLRVNFAGGAASRYSVTGSMPRAIVDAT